MTEYVVIRTEFYVPGVAGGHATSAENWSEFTSPSSAVKHLLSLMRFGDASDEDARWSGQEEFSLSDVKVWLEALINKREDFEVCRELNTAGACINVKVLYWEG